MKPQGTSSEVDLEGSACSCIYTVCLTVAVNPSIFSVFEVNMLSVLKLVLGDADRNGVPFRQQGPVAGTTQFLSLLACCATAAFV